MAYNENVQERHCAVQANDPEACKEDPVQANEFVRRK
jgi:hypothetical protein